VSKIRGALQLELIPPKGFSICRVPRLSLRTGRFFINFWCSINGIVSDWIENTAYFDVGDGDCYCTGKNMRSYTGSVFLEHEWIYKQKLEYYSQNYGFTTLLHNAHFAF